MARHLWKRQYWHLFRFFFLILQLRSHLSYFSFRRMVLLKKPCREFIQGGHPKLLKMALFVLIYSVVNWHDVTWLIAFVIRYIVPYVIYWSPHNCLVKQSLLTAHEVQRNPEVSTHKLTCLISKSSQNRNCVKAEDIVTDHTVNINTHCYYHNNLFIYLVSYWAPILCVLYFSSTSNLLFYSPLPISFVLYFLSCGNQMW